MDAKQEVKNLATLAFTAFAFPSFFGSASFSHVYRIIIEKSRIASTMANTTFELEGYGSFPLKFQKKDGGYYLMNAQFAKSEEEERNGVKCDVASTGVPDPFGTTSWNLYIGGRLHGTVPPKHLYDDDVMADLAIEIGPSPSTRSAAAPVCSRNSDSGDDGDFGDLFGMLQDELDKVKAQNKERKKETRALGLLVVQHGEDIRSREERLLHVEAEQEGLKDDQNDLKEMVKDLKRRLEALEE